MNIGDRFWTIESHSHGYKREEREIDGEKWFKEKLSIQFMICEWKLVGIRYKPFEVGETMKDFMSEDDTYFARLVCFERHGDIDESRMLAPELNAISSFETEEIHFSNKNDAIKAVEKALERTV